MHIILTQSIFLNTVIKFSLLYNKHVPYGIIKFPNNLPKLESRNIKRIWKVHLTFSIKDISNSNV